MPLTREDYMELSQLLRDNPDLRDDVRRIVLTEDLLALPEIVRDLADAERGSEVRLTRLEEAVAGLQRTTADLQKTTAGLLGTVELLAEAMRSTERRLSRTGTPAVPAVAGDATTQGGAGRAAENRVLLLQDGRRENWEDALAQWAPAPSSFP